MIVNSCAYVEELIEAEEGYYVIALAPKK